MKVGSEDRNKLIVAGSFGVLAVSYLLYTLFGGSGSSDAPPPVPVVTTVRTTPASQPATVPAHSTPSRLDPTLHPEGMLLAESLIYSGSGRNIFLPPGVAAQQAAAINIPKPIASPRYTPPTPVSTGPPPLPPIELRFFGTATSRDGKRQAFFLRGEDVLIASQGDVVGRRYRVGTITPSAVEVTDLVNNNTQRLPMSSQ